jgi:hypothetical protein
MFLLIFSFIMIALFSYKLLLLSILPFGFCQNDSFFFEEESQFSITEEPPFIPIEQGFPPRHRANLDNMHINTFGDWMPYWHFYPEIMGYVRHGNGRTDGDVGFWFLESDTDSMGRGALFLEFPPKRNSVDADPRGGSLGAYDGLFHISLRGYIRGYSVTLVTVDPVVNFGPEHPGRYTANVPFARATVLGHYVTFTGDPYKRYGFLLNRAVIWGNSPYPDFSAPPALASPVPPVKPTHSDL